MIRIALVDDHTLVREGLRKILALEDDILVAGEAGSAEDALDLVQREHPDILVLDISLPGRSGLDIIKDLKSMHADMGILVLTMHPEEVLAIRALRAGASGYLNKEVASEQLVEAVRHIYAGRRYITPAVAEQLFTVLDEQQTEEPHARLSDREYQVLLLIVQGMKNQEIADNLSISSRTVGTYRTRILEKLGLKSNAELVHYAVVHKLIAPTP